MPGRADCELLTRFSLSARQLSRLEKMRLMTSLSRGPRGLRKIKGDNVHAFLGTEWGHVPAVLTVSLW